MALNRFVVTPMRIRNEIERPRNVQSRNIGSPSLPWTLELAMKPPCLSAKA